MDDECLPVYRRRSSDAYDRRGVPRGFRIAMTPEQALRG
jgi:hypothetical protein